MIIEGVLDCALQIGTLDRLMLEAIDKCGRARDETGRTIAALERKFFDESFLNRRQFRDIALCVRFCLAFDSDDCLAVESMGIGNTGPGVDSLPSGCTSRTVQAWQTPCPQPKCVPVKLR